MSTAESISDLHAKANFTYIVFMSPDRFFFSLGICEFPSLQKEEFVFSGSSWNWNTKSDAN